MTRYALLVVAALLASAATARMVMPDKRDGSTITVETTQFNPAETNQGGTTNLAGTFNVSPLATSTSYQFQTVVQTSTFVLSGGAPVATSGGNSGSSDGSSGSSENLSSDAGGTVIVTSTASSTSTIGSPTSTATQSTSVGTGSNGLPTLALGSSAQNAGSSTNVNMIAASLACFISTALFASCLVL